LNGTATGLTAALTAAVVGLTGIQRSVDLSPVHHGSHWINVPSNLRQMNDDDTPLEVLDVSATRDVWLGASSASQPFNDCDWWYRLEVEIRRAGHVFTFQPTHLGDWIPRSSSKLPLTYPLVRVNGLDPATNYRWIARERVQPFTEVSGGESTRCEPGALRESRWTWHHVPFTFSFRTP
jgi:hypothetical protein